MSSLAILVVIASTAVGQGAQANGPNYEHLKPMEWLVGKWEASTKLDEAIPGVAEKGDKVHVTMEVKWGLNKNVLLVDITTVINGFTVSEQGMDGWDAEEGKVVGFGFDSTGARIEGIFTFGKDTVTIATKRISAEGKIEESKIVGKRLGRDKFTTQEEGGPLVEWTPVKTKE